MCPYKQVLATLKQMRDDPEGPHHEIGVRQGDLGTVIPVVIQGDYGGDLGKGQLKFVQVLLLKEGDAQKYCLPIGTIDGPEEIHILKKQFCR